MRRYLSLLSLLSRATIKAIAQASLLLSLSILAPTRSLLASPATPPSAPALAAPISIAFDSTSRTFRLDGAAVTYILGINERNELQSLYWGHRLATTDRLPAAHILPEHASFDLSTTTTPQEFAGWGSELYVEPALKITFADGNRDLVLPSATSPATSSSPSATAWTETPASSAAPPPSRTAPRPASP